MGEMNVVGSPPLTLLVIWHGWCNSQKADVLEELWTICPYIERASGHTLTPSDVHHVLTYFKTYTQARVDLWGSGCIVLNPQSWQNGPSKMHRKETRPSGKLLIMTWQRTSMKSNRLTHALLYSACSSCMYKSVSWRHSSVHLLPINMNQTFLEQASMRSHCLYASFKCSEKCLTFPGQTPSEELDLVILLNFLSNKKSAKFTLSW